jgi:hypothetical protein
MENIFEIELFPHSQEVEWNYQNINKIYQLLNGVDEKHRTVLFEEFLQYLTKEMDKKRLQELEDFLSM